MSVYSMKIKYKTLEMVAITALHHLFIPSSSTRLVITDYRSMFKGAFSLRLAAAVASTNRPLA